MAHAVIEAKKSHNLLSAIWRPRKAGGVASRLESLGSLKPWFTGSCPQGQEKIDVPAQKVRERAKERE